VCSSDLLAASVFQLAFEAHKVFTDSDNSITYVRKYTSKIEGDVAIS